jgi:hypothetical protein
MLVHKRIQRAENDGLMEYDQQVSRAYVAMFKLIEHDKQGPSLLRDTLCEQLGDHTSVKDWFKECSNHCELRKRTNFLFDSVSKLVTIWMRERILGMVVQCNVEDKTFSDVLYNYITKAANQHFVFYEWKKVEGKEDMSDVEKECLLIRLQVYHNALSEVFNMAILVGFNLASEALC